MKVQIDSQRCQGHGRCYEIAPDVFTDDERGFGVVIRAEIPDSLADQASRAHETCPEEAITIDRS